MDNGRTRTGGWTRRALLALAVAAAAAWMGGCGKNHAGAERKAGAVKTVTLPGGEKLEMVWCPPDTFTMGSPESEEGRTSDEISHQVTLTRGFWMAKTEVTQKQWQSVMGFNPSDFEGDDRPVENVSWHDCKEFCEKAGNEFRLPTEAEWEYACRAGSDGAYGGTGNLKEMGWHDKNSKGQTHPVGQKAPNAWGLHDMHGNVTEWCADSGGPYPNEALTDPLFVGGWGRVTRGGNWASPAQECRSACRRGQDPGRTHAFLGFRPVITDGIKTIELPGGAKMVMLWCPPGTFTMGSPESEEGRVDIETQHEVRLTEGFWMAKTEVTQEQWWRVMDDNPSQFADSLGSEDHPVENVSWNDCVEFCRKAGNGLQLPTEAQWEYACRAGSTGPYAGSGKLQEMGWSSEDDLLFGPDTHPVGLKRPNNWGFSDMHGNVWEWCADWFQEDLGRGAAKNPTGPKSGEGRVVRGGSAAHLPESARSASRAFSVPEEKDPFVGFRPCIVGNPP